MGYRVAELNQLIAAVRAEAARLEQELTLLPENSRPVYASVLEVYRLGMAPLDDPQRLAALLLDEDSAGLPADMRAQMHAIRDQWAQYLPQQLQTLQMAERAVEAAYGAQVAKQLADMSEQIRPPLGPAF